MTIPVVLIHCGASSRYPLATVIAHARKFGNEVILLGDETNGAIERIADYESVAVEFAQNYEHLSTNHVEFERFCIARWFILREFMSLNHIQDCLYIDSDVLLFCNAQNEYARWGSGYDFTLSLGTSPASSYFSYAGLYRFCDWVYDVYAKPGATLTEFRRIFHEMRAQDLPGGVSDMLCLKIYKAILGDARIGEMIRIANGIAWEHNINSSDGFEMRDGLKRIDFINNLPHGRTMDGKTVRFNALHFQGSAKHLLRGYAR